MPDKNVVTSKLAAIGAYLEELMPHLEQYRLGKLPLNDLRVFVIERLFQLTADAAIDINTHLITRGKLEPSDDYEGTFHILGKHGIIPADLGDAISGSVGLRNRLVRGYEKVQKKIALDDISNGIGQYVAYMKHIKSFLEKQPR